MALLELGVPIEEVYQARFDWATILSERVTYQELPQN